MSDRVLVTRTGGVADVRLARPEKLNALDKAMFDAIIETGRALGEDRSLRAVVLSGEGRAFCSGLDFASFGAAGPSLDAMLARERDSPANFAQQAAWVWAELPVPVIVAAHGYVFGGGLQIALAADMRIVTPDTQMSIMEVKWGLVPDMTGSQTLRHLVRLDVAKELTFTGRRVDAEEAVRVGLATRIADDPRAEALALAEEIATKSPDAIRAGKRLLDAAWALPLEEALLLEEAMQRDLLGSPNQLEAVQAGLQKRTPTFRDP